MLNLLIKSSELFSSCITIIDTYETGRPCLFASNSFYETTGYDPKDVIGYNLAFLQGDRTEIETIEFMRKCFKNKDACVQDILNYKKDKTPFVNRLVMIPFEDQGRTLYIGFQIDVTKKYGLEYDNKHLAKILNSEICHVVNNSLAIILGKLAIAEKYDEDLELTTKKLVQHFDKINNYIYNIESLSELKDFQYP